MRLKRMISAAMAFLVVLSAFSAIAADTYTPLDPSVNDKSFTVTYTTGEADGMYSFVVVEGDYTADKAPVPEFSEANIIYIDQSNADANGIVSFDSFIPMRETVGTVYLGGEELAEPLLLGKISYGTSEFVYGENGIVIEYNGLGGDIILPEGTTSVMKAAFINKGILSVKIPNTVTSFLEVISNIEYYYAPDNNVDLSDVELGNGVYIIGDFNNDGTVSGSDLYSFVRLKAGNKDISADEKQGDVNLSGSTTLSDITLLRKYIELIASAME